MLPNIEYDLYHPDKVSYSILCPPMRSTRAHIEESFKHYENVVQCPRTTGI